MKSNYVDTYEERGRWRVFYLLGLISILGYEIFF